MKGKINEPLIMTNTILLKLVANSNGGFGGGKKGKSVEKQPNGNFECPWKVSNSHKIFKSKGGLRGE